MVKLRKVRTESPATTLGILSFRLSTGAPQIHPKEFFVILGIFVLIEIAVSIFFSL